jgi:hypothetical protein
MVAQIDEQQLPMIALAVHPARQAHGLAGFGAAQGVASMRAIGVHEKFPAAKSE